MLLTASSALLFAAFSLASPTLQERAVCNADNLIRCFSASAGPASAYCSSYVTAKTVTIATVTPTTTTRVTVTAAPAAKREAALRRDVVGPRCLSKNGNDDISYPASRITSACSCIGITQATISATATASPVTVTRTTTVTPTATACPTFIRATGLPLAYRQFYTGSGFTETDSNPGNVNPGPSQTTIPRGTPVCDALVACANYAANVARDYYSFQLYRLRSTGVYTCRAYRDRNADPAFFNVPNPDVDVAYGYS
ncbi:MAG: hypothetical protein M1833_002849 [Piccolia ochrophora]|nr:MAG: hypothetical protein M1833_002849 [Piccolia ochrophora]